MLSYPNPKVNFALKPTKNSHTVVKGESQIVATTYFAVSKNLKLIQKKQKGLIFMHLNGKKILELD